MRVHLDTTVVVDVDRGREPTLELLETLTAQGASLSISTVTVAEILTGANLRADTKEATLAAKRVLGQFDWIELDGGAAETTAGLLAYLHAEGKPIEFQDVVIAACALEADADALVTSNREHLARLPPVAEMTYEPEALLSRIG